MSRPLVEIFEEILGKYLQVRTRVIWEISGNIGESLSALDIYVLDLWNEAREGQGLTKDHDLPNGCKLRGERCCDILTEEEHVLKYGHVNYK